MLIGINCRLEYLQFNFVVCVRRNKYIRTKRIEDINAITKTMVNIYVV